MRFDFQFGSRFSHNARLSHSPLWRFVMTAQPSPIVEVRLPFTVDGHVFKGLLG